jgi:hypothetical protein
MPDAKAQHAEWFERFLIRVFPLAKRKLVDIDQIPIRLRQLSEQELDELNHFSPIMMTEILQRIGQLETKSIVIFGYNGALVAFLLNALRWMHPNIWLNVLICGTLFLVTCSALLAAYAFIVRTRWQWPSERDWFPEKAFGNLHAIKRRHLDALLNAHQQQSQRADVKGVAVIWAQRLTVLSLLGLIAIFVAVLAFKNIVGVST